MTTCKLNNLDLSCQMQESLYDPYRRGDHRSSADFVTGKIRRRQAKILHIFPGIIRKSLIFGGRAMLAPTVLTGIVHFLSSPISFTNTTDKRPAASQRALCLSIPDVQRGTAPGQWHRSTGLRVCGRSRQTRSCRQPHADRSGCPGSCCPG